MAVEIISSGVDIAAEIKGVDLSKPSTVEEVVAISKAFVEHAVLIFRNQSLLARQFADISGHFGELRVYI